MASLGPDEIKADAEAKAKRKNAAAPLTTKAVEDTDELRKDIAEAEQAADDDSDSSSDSSDSDDGSDSDSGSDSELEDLAVKRKREKKEEAAAKARATRAKNGTSAAGKRKRDGEGKGTAKKKGKATARAALDDESLLQIAQDEEPAVKPPYEPWKDSQYEIDKAKTTAENKEKLRALGVEFARKQLESEVSMPVTTPGPSRAVPPPVPRPKPTPLKKKAASPLRNQVLRRSLRGEAPPEDDNSMLIDEDGDPAPHGDGLDPDQMDIDVQARVELPEPELPVPSPERPAPASSASVALESPAALGTAVIARASDGPGWFTIPITDITHVNLGKDYAHIIRVLTQLEAGYGWKSSARSTLKSRSRVPRPAQLSTWIAGGRGRTVKTTPPAIGDVGVYGSEWWTWWRSLQPDWRLSGADATRCLQPVAPRGHWGDLVVPGANGMLGVAATVYWWGCAVREMGTAEREAWEEALKDVQYALRGLLFSQAPL